LFWIPGYQNERAQSVGRYTVEEILELGSASPSVSPCFTDKQVTIWIVLYKSFTLFDEIIKGKT
jgi:hypothetical protein